MATDQDKLKEIVKILQPWRHDIDLGNFSTFDVAETVGPFSDASHPTPRGNRVSELLDDNIKTVADLGCNAGGISFILEENGYDVTGVDSSDITHSPTDPLLQARVCKQVKRSDVDIIDEDVRSHLRDCSTYDAIVACGLLYHIGEGELSRERDINAEEEFIDLMIEKADKQIVFETDYTEWLSNYISDRADVYYEADINKSVYGVRHIVAANIDI